MPATKKINSSKACELLGGLDLHRASVPSLKMLSEVLTSYVENDGDCEEERFENGEHEPHQVTLAKTLLLRVNQKLVDRLGAGLEPEPTPAKTKRISPAP